MRWTLALAALGVGTALVFAQVVGHEFISYDDDEYVTANAHVLRGVRWEGVAWAVTSTEAANWHPVTWLSHMLDVELFGMSPGAHHAVNVGIHALAAVLLALVWWRMTGAMGRSLALAALFAIHPLRAESVAWVAERKDVLSTLLWIVTIGAYVEYVRRPALGRYLLVLAAYALGLMAKPTLVTLPFALLLLDGWPLGRFARGPIRWSAFAPLVREKLPLLALAAASSAITYVAQSRGDAVSRAGASPLTERVANALVAYVAYLWKTVWPTDLAVLYPHPSLTAGGLPAWQVAGSAVLLAALSAWVVAQRRARPYLLVGWLWFLGTLVPVIGLVQVGLQSMADRYAYVPHIGLLAAVVWGVHDLASTERLRRGAAVVAACAVLALSAVTWHQLGFWKDHETLFRHAIAVTRDNSPAHAGLAAWLGTHGRPAEALAHAREAVRLAPRNLIAWKNLSVALRVEGSPQEAVSAAQEAVRLAGSDAESWRYLGLAQREAGDPAEAKRALDEALRLAPGQARTWMDLASVELILGRAEDASAAMREAVRLEAGDPQLWFNLGVVEGMAGRTEQAVVAYSNAVRLNPRYVAAWRNLAIMQERAGRSAEAAQSFAEAERWSGTAPAPTAR